MDVFNYMKTDIDNISERLTELTENYSEWAQDRVFEESKNVLGAIKTHFQKEQLLVNNLKDRTGLEHLLSQAEKQQQDIKSEMEQLVMIHVDEPGFEQGLESIENKFADHHKFCMDTFYPRLKSRLTSKGLQSVTAQIEQKVLS